LVAGLPTVWRYLTAASASSRIIFNGLGQLKSMIEKFNRYNRFSIFWGLILLFVFCIPVSQLLATRLLFVAVIFSLFLGDFKQGIRKFLILSWDGILFLSTLLIGLIFSDDIPTGLRVIETSLSLIALPLVFSKLGFIDKPRLHKIFEAFSAGLILASLICLVNAAYQYSIHGDADVFLFDKLTEVIDSHPTYLAYYLIASLTFGLNLLYYEKTRISFFGIVTYLVFAFLVLMLTGGLTAYVSMLFIFAFFLLKYILEEKTRIRTVSFVLAVLMIGCMFLFRASGDEGAAVKSNDYWERMVLWESAMNANPNPLLGVGTGDYKTILNEYYLSHDLSRFAGANYNAHNQFIEIFFSNGIIGLICVLILLARPLYMSTRNANVFGTLIFFPFLIYGMTEVFLGRFQGVVFFALMHQSFISYYQSFNRPFSLKDS
jgi:O-antigen ligase